MNATTNELTARLFLERRGYEVLDPGSVGSGIVAVDPDGETIVFADVAELDLGGDSIERARAEREADAARWLAAHDGAIDAPLRFDAVAVAVIDGDRALVRHHIDCLGTEEG